MNKARIIICGSRSFDDYELLKNCLDNFFKDNPDYSFTVISGTASGADKIGERYATEKRLPLERFPAKWNVYGKSAGYIRNAEMLDYAMADDAEPFVMAFWDGESHGTKQMIRLAKSKNVKTIIHKIEVVK